MSTHSADLSETKLAGGVGHSLSGSIGGMPERSGAQEHCRELDVVGEPIDREVTGVQHPAQPGDLCDAVHGACAGGKVLLAFASLMVAAAVAVGSGANFNSTSANPSNVFTAGTLSHSNSKASTAILTATNIVPGATATGTVDIKNTGSASGTFTLTKTTPVDTPTAPGLSKKLTLTIVDQGDPACSSSCPAAVTIYSGGTIFAQGASIPLGVFPAGATHRYVYTMNFPDGGTGGADNAYQGASTTVDYNWSSTS